MRYVHFLAKCIDSKMPILGTYEAGIASDFSLNVFVSQATQEKLERVKEQSSNLLLEFKRMLCSKYER